MAGDASAAAALPMVTPSDSCARLQPNSSDSGATKTPSTGLKNTTEAKLAAAVAPTITQP